jgi:gliding motility-associated-like protein
MSNHYKQIGLFIVFGIFAPIFLHAQLQISGSGTPPSCFGYTDGQVTLNVTGGTAPYSYKWSNGQGGATVFGLSAGVYGVTVTDAANRTANSSVTVTQPAQLVANIAPSGGNCDDNMSFTPSATGGTAPYTYVWRNLDNGQTINTPILSNPTRNTYSLQVTDAKGCTAYKTVVVNGKMEVNLRIENVICGGDCDGVITALVTGGAFPYTYLWSYQNKTTQALSPVPGGTYTVTVTDANGCQKTATGTVVEPEPLKVNAKAIGECTDNASGTVNPTGGKAPYTIKWSTGATTATTNLPQGVHFVTVTDALGCNRSEKVSISKAMGLMVMLMQKDFTCTSASVEACIPGGGLGPYTFQWSNGMNTQVIMNVGAGTYKVTVIDGAGCRDSAVTIIEAPKSLKVNASAKNALCNNNTGSATVDNVENGAAPFTYKWSNNLTTASITGLAGGDYSVTVTDAKGCTANAKVTVNTEGGINAVAFAKTNASCGGKTDGSATAQPTGTGPFNYVWSTGATTATISNVAAGTYKVSVSNTAGCNTTASVNIDNAKNLVMKTSTSNAECTANSGAATVTDITGGTGPFIFRWSNGATTQTASNLSAGTISVTVTDAQGCSVSQDSIVVKANGSTVGVTVDKTDVSCSGLNNGKLSSKATGTAPFKYLWSNGATTADINNAAAGTYTVTVTDAAGCKAEARVTVNSGSNLVLTTSTTNAECGTANGAASVTNVLGGVGPFMYIWSNRQTTQTATNINAGTYSVTVTDVQGCQATKDNIVVNANNANIVANPKVTAATCKNANGKVEFDISGGKAPYTVRWSGGTNLTNIAAGTYTFTVTDAAGCTKEQIVTINANGNIQAAFTTTPTANATNKCDSANYDFKNTTTGTTAGATYRWLFSNNRTATTTDANATFGGTSGIITLIATSAEGCSDTTRQTVNLNVVNVDIQDTATTCQGTNATILVRNNNPNVSVTYRWLPDSLIVSGGTTANPVLRTNSVGIRKVYVDISNGAGCTKRDSVLLNSLAKDAIKPSDISFKQDCDTRRVTFTNRSPLASQYTWRFGDPSNPNANSTEVSPVYTYGQAGNITVTLIPKVACLDTVRLQVPVRNGSAVSVIANRDSVVCVATPIRLRATSINAQRLEWSQSPTFTPLSGTRDTLSVNPVNRVNTYYVRATDTITGCTAVDTVVINNYALRITAPSAFNACKGVDTSITIENNTPDVLTYAWTPTNIITGAANQNRVVIKVTNDATLRATVSNQFGCTQDLTIPITAREVDAKAFVSDSVIYVDDKVDLSSSPIGTGYSYKWLPASDIVSPDSAFSKAAPKTDTKYTIQVTDQYSCKDTASVNVKVLTPQCSEPFVFIPKAFSPNNDGINEKVFVRGEYLKEEGFEFAIYNRWGEKVFFTKNQKEGWDGMHKGGFVCPDVYGYYVKGICEKGEVFFKKGNITVLK